MPQIINYLHLIKTNKILLSCELVRLTDIVEDFITEHYIENQQILQRSRRVTVRLLRVIIS